MHQAQWSPERPLPPPVSLASQSHHEKPPEVQEGIFVDTPTIAELLGKDTAKVYRLLLQDGGMTISDMAKKLRLSSRGVRYHIEKIKNANLLRRVGGRKFGHWEVVK